MRSIRIYSDTTITPEAPFTLSDSASHHLLRVLRCQIGQPLEVFDGSGVSYVGEIVDIAAKRAIVRVTDTLPGIAPSPIDTHLGIVMSKGDRVDYAVQKATELGVNRITPLDSERCEMRLKGSRAEKKQQQWQQIAIAACEQCGRNDMPEVSAVESLASWVAAVTADTKLVLHPRHAQPLSSEPTPSSVALLIGPEGGLSDQEIDTANDHGFHSTLFGPRILRTETAPVVALTMVQAIWGDIDLSV